MTFFGRPDPPKMIFFGRSIRTQMSFFGRLDSSQMSFFSLPETHPPVTFHWRTSKSLLPLFGLAGRLVCTC